MILFISHLTFLLVKNLREIWCHRLLRVTDSWCGQKVATCDAEPSDRRVERAKYILSSQSKEACSNGLLDNKTYLDDLAATVKGWEGGEASRQDAAALETRLLWEEGTGHTIQVSVPAMPLLL